MQLMLSLFLLSTRILAVGDGHPYSRIDDAIRDAKPGDTVTIYKKSSGYHATAMRILTPRIRVVGMSSEKIVLDGEGFEYSGAGSVPRAIVQLEPTASDVTIENLEFRGAHNQSFNGAGVRINGAMRATVRDCVIHGNDMGIMSNGAANEPDAATEQLIDHCRIYANGNLKDPGYNHNLYLGGTSVTVQFCEIYGALTGHNLKSRAHFNLVRYCHIYDSANRELDFVEAWDTERADSNAVLIGNVIAKDPGCKGNRAVIHFGQEKGKRNGQIYLFHNTIVTPFQSPVVMVTSPQASLEMDGNVIYNPAEASPQLASLVPGMSSQAVQGRANWISHNYDLGSTALAPAQQTMGTLKGAAPSDAFAQTLCVGGTGHLSETTLRYRDGEGRAQDGMPKYRFTPAGKWVPGTPASFGAG